MKPSERLNAVTGSGALFAGVQEPVLFIERLPQASTERSRGGCTCVPAQD